MPQTSRRAPNLSASHSTARWVLTVPISSQMFGASDMSSAIARSLRVAGVEQQDPQLRQPRGEREQLGGRGLLQVDGDDGVDGVQPAQGDGSREVEPVPFRAQAHHRDLPRGDRRERLGHHDGDGDQPRVVEREERLVARVGVGVEAQRVSHVGSLDAQAVHLGPRVLRQVVEGHGPDQAVRVNQFRHRPNLTLWAPGVKPDSCQLLPDSAQAFHEPGSKCSWGLVYHSSPSPVASSLASVPSS
ncbi:hypothetical protein GCM10020219_039730 [Nonomuraea dietziae]